MAWQNLLVVVIAGAVLVGGTVLVLWVVKERRDKARFRAERDAALDVIARLNDREEIRALSDEELHDEILDMLDRYRADGGTG